HALFDAERISSVGGFARRGDPNAEPPKLGNGPVPWKFKFGETTLSAWPLGASKRIWNVVTDTAAGLGSAR
ncbi:MAG: hypothetical protein AAFY31_03855, partial [Pseudomonadota bacterium]